MKRFKKISKWVSITFLLLIIVTCVTVAMRQNMHYDAPYPAINASTDTAIINRGKHLVFSSAHCASCHSTANADSLLRLGIEPSLSGGYKFDLEIGTVYAKNITSDKETGIGKLTDAEIARTLYYGVGHDGRTMFDFMPFHNISETDMQAIISYIRTQKPVKNIIPQNKYNLLGRVVKAFLLKPTGPSGAIPKNITPDTTAQYGSYLINYVGNCNGCHTQRDQMTGDYIGNYLAGGNIIEGFVTPNITTDSSSRIFKWSYNQFKNRIKLGKQIPTTPMPWNSFKMMTDDELKAIYSYLQTVKPAKMPALK